MLVGDLEDRFGQLHVHPQLDGGRRLELRGELDLTAKALRTPLPDQLTGSGPVTLDLDGVNYLSSAGVGCSSTLPSTPRRTTSRCSCSWRRTASSPGC
jgi:hypothetical protein